MMSDLTDLPNVGPALARALTEAGIDTPAAPVTRDVDIWGSPYLEA